MRASRVLAVLGDENSGPNRSVDAIVVGKRSLTAVPAKSCSSCAGKDAELAVLKGESREQDGKVVLLKFQLEKRKKQCQQLSAELAKLAQLSLPAVVPYPHSHSPDRQAWTQHWRRTQANLRLLRRSFRLADRVLVERRARAANVLNASTGTLRGDDDDEEARTLCSDDDEEDEEDEEEEIDEEEDEDRDEESEMVDETVDGHLVGALQLKLDAQDDFIQRLRLQMQAWVVEAESLARPQVTNRPQIESGQREEQKEEQKVEQREEVPVPELPPTPSVRVALEDACPRSLIRKILEPASAAATPASAPSTARTTTPRMLRGIFEGLGSRESSSPRAAPRAAESEVGSLEPEASMPSPAVVAVEEEAGVKEQEAAAETREADRWATASTPTTNRSSSSSSSFGSAEIRSAWAAWGARRYTQVASAATVQPAQVVVSPSGLTPGAFKQQMAHLRSENSMIRGEIQRFRADIRRLRDEQE